MSTEEEDAILARLLRGLREGRKELALIQSEIARWAKLFGDSSKSLTASLEDDAAEFFSHVWENAPS